MQHFGYNHYLFKHNHRHCACYPYLAFCRRLSSANLFVIGIPGRLQVQDLKELSKTLEFTVISNIEG